MSQRDFDGLAHMVACLLWSGLLIYANPAVVDGVGKLFGAPERPTALSVVSDVANPLHARLVELAEDIPGDSLRALQEPLPISAQLEHRNLGPHENILDFEVFQGPIKQGRNVLFVGDSTLSWGFSLDHFSAAGVRAYAIAFGMNTSDLDLLKVVELVADCRFESRPVVMVSHSLNSLRIGIRRRRRIDQTVRSIAALPDCGALEAFIDSSSTASDAARSGSGAEMPLFRRVLQGYETYRASWQRASDSVVLPELKTLNILHAIEVSGRQRGVLRYVRWRPEFRVPMRPNKAYDRYRTFPPSSRRSAGNSDASRKALVRMYRLWAGYGGRSCALVPITMRDEHVRHESWQEAGEDICLIDLAAVLERDEVSLPLAMSGNHHLADVSGLIVALHLGRYVAEHWDVLTDASHASKSHP